MNLSEFELRMSVLIRLFLLPLELDSATPTSQLNLSVVLSDYPTILQLFYFLQTYPKVCVI